MSVEQMNTGLVSVELERECTQFLFREAELLDEHRFSEWSQTCLSKDLEYLVPVRTTRERASGVSDFNDTGFHMKDNHLSMQLRVARLATEHAWAEDPASRTRRLVTNIRVRELESGEVEVKSYLMLYRSQGDTARFDIITGERQDILRSEENGWRLRRRLVLLSHTILGTANLGVFL